MCDVFRSAGIDIPSRVIVTGFDGYDEVDYTVPKIATVDCSNELLAEKTAEAAIEVMDGIGAGKKYLVMPELVPNESCGCESCVRNTSSSLLDFNNKFYRYQDDVRYLYDMTAKFQLSHTPEQAVKHLRCDITHDACYIADSACFCRERNIFFEPFLRFARTERQVIYDNYADDGICPIDENDIVPGIEKRFEPGYPLFFNVLDFMNRPMGYICYSFTDYNINDYANTVSITNAVSMSLGGYVNIHHQQYLSETISDMYKNDALTGLYNRMGFDYAASELLGAPDSLGKDITVIMADLDGLKYINDTFGHDAGDIAISAAALSFRSSCPENAVCVRFGGDEILALILGKCDSAKIISDTEKHLSDVNRHSGYQFLINLSLGAYTTTLTEDFAFDEAIKNADNAMYSIKKKKKQEKKKTDNRSKP